jgi:lysyl-tRNA synthetase, class II
MLTQKFLSAELLEWSISSGLYPQIESILENIEKGYYEPEKGSKMILALIEFALDKKEPSLMGFDDFKSLVDEGDYVQVSGKLDYSNTGEPSLFADNITILAKSLRPLPDTMKYDNTESRYLDRVADFKNNTKDDKGNSVRDIVRAKAKYWSIWREEMEKEGFLEVECPVFESIPGGAEAKPFTTFYNELDQDMYLRISLELPLKKLISGGFEKVYEIGRIFRNEGSSPQHLQEYTQIEWYCAYTDYLWAAKFTKRVYQRVVKEILNTEIQIDYYGNKINWGNWCTPKMAKENGWIMLDDKDGWPMIPYFDAVRYFSKGEIDTENKTAEELCELGKKFDLELTPDLGMGTLLDKLWKKARVNTTDPFFLTLPPVELEPLAKRDPKNPELTQRWQVVAGRAEHGKAFSELNDPIDQFGRFEDQQKARDAGNEEAQFMDPEYIKAMEYGMPPMSGFGVSERFVSSLLGKHIRECVAFPHVRRESKNSKTKETQVAHAIILNSEDVPMWSQMNAAAHLSASLAARQGDKLIWIDKNTTTDGVDIPMNIQHAIIMKTTDQRLKLLELKNEAEKAGLVVTCFTEEMRESSNDAIVTEKQSKKSSTDIGWLGVLVFGKKTKVEKLTESFTRFGNEDNTPKSNTTKNQPSSKSFEDLNFGNGTVLEYWKDSYLTESLAKILSLETDEIGTFVTLDKTIFYPQGGGQPTDIGGIKVNSQTVFKVTKCLKFDNIVKHYGEIVVENLTPGTNVELSVNKENRIQNISLHSTAHLMDYAVNELNLGWVAEKGYSFPEGPYVQYSGEVKVSDKLIADIETKVNELRLQNMDFVVNYTQDGEQIYRSILIKGVSDCACGGTHINNTKELPPIKIRKISCKKGVIKLSYCME